MRLVGASVPNVGRVEVFYAGVWGAIGSYNWDINDAHVVCRQLGYPGAISSGYSNQFSVGTGPVLLRNVRCFGNESNFGQCSKDVYGYSSPFVSTASCKLPYQSGENERLYLSICISALTFSMLVKSIIIFLKWVIDNEIYGSTRQICTGT